MHLQPHPLADTYPLEPHAIQALAEDLSARGFDPGHPIVVDAKTGLLIDGRTRLAAAEQAGVRPAIRRRTFESEQEIAEYVTRANDLRRGTLSKYQRLVHAILWAEALGQPRPHVTKLRAASGFGSLGAVNRAVDMHDSGSPESEKYWLGLGTFAEIPRAQRSPRTTTPERRSATVSEVREAERAKRQAREAKARERELLAEAEQLHERVRALSELTAQPMPPVRRTEYTSGLREATAVALISDLHVEEMVTPSADTAGNAYNLAIADLRLRRLFSAIEWSVEHSQSAFQIRTLVVWLGGDLTTGQLHEENLETGQLAPLEAMLWVQDRIAAGLRQLLESPCAFEEIRVVCSYGNHGRFTKRMRAGTGAGHNSDWLMYQTLAQMFATEPRIRFLADAAEHQYLDVYDFKLHFHHGHRVSYGGGVGGISIPINKAVAQWDRARNCDYHHFGHFHQYLDLGHVVVNGSGIGFNAYAMSIKAAPEVPQQAFYLLDSRRGKSQRTPLWVGSPEQERELWSAHWETDSNE